MEDALRRHRKKIANLTYFCRGREGWRRRRRHRIAEDIERRPSPPSGQHLRCTLRWRGQGRPASAMPQGHAGVHRDLTGGKYLSEIRIKLRRPVGAGSRQCARHRERKHDDRQGGGQKTNPCRIINRNRSGPTSATTARTAERPRRWLPASPSSGRARPGSRERQEGALGTRCTPPARGGRRRALWRRPLRRGSSSRGAQDVAVTSASASRRARAVEEPSASAQRGAEAPSWRERQGSRMQLGARRLASRLRGTWCKLIAPEVTRSGVQNAAASPDSADDRSAVA